MKRVIYRNPRSVEYDDYLDKHITGVVRSWEEILRPQLVDHMSDFNITESGIKAIDAIVPKHDASKYSLSEYAPYCNYFYPSEGFAKDEAAFDNAWLLHQNRNPHHYQFWVLIRDSGESDAQDMPFEYICEMLCDWHSFTLRDPESTAKSWWDNNRDNMVLSTKTIATIEKLIEYFKEPLTNT